MGKSPIPFTVAMSVYKNDNPKWLRIALNSVCTQSYEPDEIYMVIDGPIDDSLESVVEEFRKKFTFFKIKRFEQNKGRGDVLRDTFLNCKNELVAIMDSDDIAAPGRFRKQIESYIQEPVDVLGGWTLGFSDEIESGKISWSNRKLKHDDIVNMAKKQCPVSQVTVLLKKSAVLAAGNYLDLYYHEDYFLWIRMIEKGFIFKNIPEYLVYVRLGAGQARRHGGWKYFKAEYKMRNYMLQKKLCSKLDYIKQISIRFVYSVVLLPSVRNYINMKFKRKYMDRNDVDIILEKNKSTDDKFLMGVYNNENNT